MKLDKSNNNSVSTFFYANTISARSHACHTRLQRHQSRTEMLNADNIQRILSKSVENKQKPANKQTKNKQTNKQTNKTKADIFDLGNVLEDDAFCILYLKSETRKKFCYLWIGLWFYLQSKPLNVFVGLLKCMSVEQVFAT